MNCDTIAFADPALESAIQSQLDTGSPITPDDIAQLKTLDARGFNVSLLGGIECFTELTDLNLGVGGAPSDVTDLGPLRYLRNLTTLDLDDNPLDDLTPLASLPNLQQLILDSTPADLDLGPLANCPSLTDLSLIDDTLDDLIPLGAIATLSRLQLNSTILNQPATLSALKNVKELHVYNASITDATPRRVPDAAALARHRWQCWADELQQAEHTRQASRSSTPASMTSTTSITGAAGHEEHGSRSP